MGLDMYLYAKRYRGLRDEEIEYPQELEDFKVNYKSVYEEFKIGYWRKFNALHSWIVEKCADGVDDCREIYIPEEIIKEIVKNCEEILENNSKGKAEELMPTKSGFFFGSLDYDEYYFQDLEYTYNLFKKILDDGLTGEYDIIYNASW